MKNLIGIVNELGKKLFTGQLIINFHKGTVGKVQVAKTFKPKELVQHDASSLY